MRYIYPSIRTIKVKKTHRLELFISRRKFITIIFPTAVYSPTSLLEGHLNQCLDILRSPNCSFTVFICFWGAWVAQLIECPSLGSGSSHDLQPNNAEHGDCLGFSLSFSLCLPPPTNIQFSSVSFEYMVDDFLRCIFQFIISFFKFK